MQKKIVQNKVVEIEKIRSSGKSEAAYKTTTLIGRDGEVIREQTTAVSKRNGGGFVLSYTEKMCDFLKSVSTSSIIRVFLFLAHNQNYGVNGMFGFRCSRKFLHETLNIDRKSVYSALQYLIDNFLVVENRIDGQLEFMVNPEYVTIGTDKKARLREWSRRWEWYFKKNRAEK